MPDPSFTTIPIATNRVNCLPQLQPNLHFDTHRQLPESVETTVEPSGDEEETIVDTMQPVANGSADASRQVNGFNDSGNHSSNVQVEVVVGDERPLLKNQNREVQVIVNQTEANVVEPARPKIGSIQKQSASFLIIESLVWALCGNFEKNSEKREKLYIGLCKRLAGFDVLSTSFLEESLHPLRDRISLIIHDEIQQQQNCLNNGETGLLYNTSLNMIQPTSKREDISSDRFWSFDRFKIEFNEVGAIAKGGFGKVYKAYHRFDNALYAVKEIQFYFRTHHSFSQIIREVKLYANLEPHANVISYKTAWIQNWSVDFSTGKGICTGNDSQQSEESIVANDCSTCDTTNSNSCSLLTSQATVDNNLSSEVENLRHEALDNDTFSSVCTLVEFKESSESDERNTPDEKLSDNSKISPNEAKAVALPTQNVTNRPVCRAKLYIQMELCGINFKAYLEKRNKTIADKRTAGPSPLPDPLDLIDVDLERNHFEQILNGVKYIHSKNIIHRDIKPANILFSLDNKRLQIGDFGLSTLFQDCVVNEPLPMTPSTAPTAPVKIATSSKSRTLCLGTADYSAPEQRSKQVCQYDHRVDIYSLGIILLEIFYPYNARSEFITLIMRIKEHRGLPDNLTNRWPKLAELILQLTSYSPCDRPYSIESISRLFSKAFSCPNDSLLAEPVLSAATTFTTNTAPIECLSPVQVNKVLQKNQCLMEQIAEMQKLLAEKDRRIQELELKLNQQQREKSHH